MDNFCSVCESPTVTWKRYDTAKKINFGEKALKDILFQVSKSPIKLFYLISRENTAFTQYQRFRFKGLCCTRLLG